MSNVGKPADTVSSSKGVVSGAARVPMNQKKIITIVAIAILLIGALLYFFVIRAQYSATEKAAIDDMNAAAKDFSKDSDGYSYTRLNKAVEYAAKDKCTEARTIYDEASKTPNGLKPEVIDLYKKRIEDLCSGKKPTTTNELD